MILSQTQNSSGVPSNVESNLKLRSEDVKSAAVQGKTKWWTRKVGGGGNEKRQIFVTSTLFRTLFISLNCADKNEAFQAVGPPAKFQ